MDHLPTVFLPVVAAGITFFLVYSEAGDPVNRLLSRVKLLDRMLRCSFCTGYWIGALLAGFELLWKQANVSLSDFLLYSVFMGFCGAVSSFVLEKAAWVGESLLSIDAKYNPAILEESDAIESTVKDIQNSQGEPS